MDAEGRFQQMVAFFGYFYIDPGVRILEDDLFYCYGQQFLEVDVMESINCAVM